MYLMANVDYQMCAVQRLLYMIPDTAAIVIKALLNVHDQLMLQNFT